MLYASENRARLRSAGIGRRCLCLRRLLAKRAGDAFPQDASIVPLVSWGPQTAAT